MFDWPWITFFCKFRIYYMKSFKIAFLLLPIVFTAQSCELFSTGGTQQGSGNLGVYLSVDSGDSWKAGVGTQTFQMGSVAISKIFIQSRDPKNVVAASTNAGVLASDNHGENWVVLLTGFAAQDIFINPFNEQEIFVSGSKGKLAAIYKSPDRGATWIQVYNEPSGESAVTALAYDLENPQIMYAGLSTGTMLKSADGGDTWNWFASFKDRVVEIGVRSGGVYVL